MRFGKCRVCFEYKFLHSDSGMCPSCSDSDEEWVVVHVHPFGGRVIEEDGLTKEEARKIASKGRYFTARKKSKVKA